MPQAKSALARFLLQTEVAFRTAPAPAAKVIPVSRWDVKPTPNRQQNDTINQSLLRDKSDAGDPTVSGSFGSILDLRSIGNWLKLAFGAATVGKAVTNQPTLVTGVTVHYASSDCTSGLGTLTYTAIGTTLTWACQGGAAGAAVNVGAGGNFTLLSAAGPKSVRVTVVVASLPVGNAADADISVHATLKAHAFPVNVALLPSALLERQHSDNAKYHRVLGGKLGRLGWDLTANEQNVSGDIVAAVETEENAAFDANPTAYAAVRACSAKSVVNDGVTNGAAGLGIVTGGTIDINNNLTGYLCTDGLEGYGFIDEGEKAIGGSLKTVFDHAGAYALAKANTSTRLHLESAAPVGADTFRLVFDCLDVELEENLPPVEGKSGLFVDIAWKMHKGVYAPEIYLVNDVAAY